MDADSVESALKMAGFFDAAIFAESVFEAVEEEFAQRLLSLAGRKKTIVLRSSPVHANHPRQSSVLDVAAQLTKPVVPHELYEMLLDIRSSRATLPAGETSKIADDAQLNLRVLLAEDNPVNQRLIVKMLERIGCSVVVAQNGKDAVAAFEKDPQLDAILMDIQMPDMDGFQATAAIRAIQKQRGGHILVIALTAHAMTGDQEKCLSAGMDAYLSKPISFSKLRSLLENNQRASLRSESHAQAHAD
jgi:CheY-like chemotaxis protein